MNPLDFEFFGGLSIFSIHLLAWFGIFFFPEWKALSYTCVLYLPCIFNQFKESGHLITPSTKIATNISIQTIKKPCALKSSIHAYDCYSINAGVIVYTCNGSRKALRILLGMQCSNMYLLKNACNQTSPFCLLKKNGLAMLEPPLTALSC